MASHQPLLHSSRFCLPESDLFSWLEKKKITLHNNDASYIINSHTIRRIRNLF